MMDYGLPPELQIEFTKKQKSKVTAYLLWFFLGWLGLHRIYLNSKIGYAYMISIIAFILSGLTAPGSILHGFATFLFIIFYLAMILDIFLIPGMVNRRNAKLAQELMAQKNSA